VPLGDISKVKRKRVKKCEKHGQRREERGRRKHSKDGRRR